MYHIIFFTPCVWVCVLDRYSKVRQTGVCHTDRKTIGLCFDLQSLPVVTDTGVPPRGGERKAVAWPAEPHLHPHLYTASLNIPDGGCHAPCDLHCFPVDAIVRFVFHPSSKGLMWPPTELTDRPLFGSQPPFLNLDWAQDSWVNRLW